MQSRTLDANTLLILSLALPVAFALARVLGELVLSALAERLPAAKRSRIEQIVAQAVAAVESAAKDVPGAQKKQIAVQLIGDALRAARLSATEQQISVLIDAAVTALKVAAGVATKA